MNFPLLGIFGGTFDPIHKGHLAVLNRLIEKFPFTNIQLIPCGQPPHRPKPVASPVDRLEMIKCAIIDHPIFSVNNIEVTRKEISYTIYTLKSLRNSFSKHCICFILSSDAFSDFRLWHRYAEFLTYCHLIVINRGTYQLPTEKWLLTLLQHRTENPNDLKQFLSEKIFFQQVPTYPISATKIRNYLVKGNYSAVKSMLPKAVFEYIKKHNLYRGQTCEI